MPRYSKANYEQLSRLAKLDDQTAEGFLQLDEATQREMVALATEHAKDARLSQQDRELAKARLREYQRLLRKAHRTKR